MKQKDFIYIQSVMMRYTIVGGVPAKPIRKRFDDETIQKLENIRWWNWDEKQIRKSIQAIQAGNIIELEKISNEQGKH